MQIISQSAPFIPNISKLAERTGVSRATLTSYLKYLEETDLLISLYKESGGMTVLQKPEKIYLENSNLMFVLGIDRVNTGNLRETFFANQLSFEHTLKYSPKADFLVDDKYTFEIGGKNKPKHQIQATENAYIASDDIEFGAFNRIPLWMFGLMY